MVFNNVFIPPIIKHVLGLALSYYIVADVLLIHALVMFEHYVGNKEPCRRLITIWLLSIITLIGLNVVS